MTRIIVGLLWMFLAGLMTATSSVAQEPHHSRISIVHPGFESLKTDLKSLIDLTTAEEQEQWIDIQDYIDMFQIGIDGTRPVRIDVLTGMVPTAYLIWVPLQTPEDRKASLVDEFRESLDGFGYSTTRDPQDRNLYRMENTEDASDTGWLRVMSDIKYGIFTQTTDQQDMQLLKQLIQKAGDPAKDVAELLATKPGIAVEGVNSAESEADQARRKEAFQELRKTSMDTIQKRPEETSTEFELRRALLDHQLDEGERLMVEARLIRMTGTLDHQANTASMAVTATAIAGTSLAESIASFGQTPDAFAALPKSEGSALSLRLNHPIDRMRQENVKETLSLGQKDLHNRIDSSKDMSDAEKSAAKELTAGIQSMIEEGVSTGNINAFMESVPAADEGFTTVSAVSVPNAVRLKELLPLVGRAGQNNQVQMDVDSAGDITIHRVRLAQGFVTLIDRIFGEGKDLYVGIAESHVWLASGPDSLAALKAKIGQMGEPATSTTCLHVELQALPWVKHLDRIASTSEVGKTLEEKEQQRSLKRTRDRAMTAMSDGNDTMTLTFTVENGTVSGQFFADEGMMRFLGKMLAAFSKENFGG